MEADHRNPPAPEWRGVAGRVRPLQANPAIREAQSRHDARWLQGDLLVGVDPSPAGPHRGRGVHPAGVMVLVEGSAQGRARPTGRGRDRAARSRADCRLVDGDLRPERAHRGGAGAIGAAPHDRCGNLWRAHVRRRRTRRPAAGGHVAARLCDFGLDLRGPYLLSASASALSSRAYAPASSTTPGRSWDRALSRARRFARIRCKRSSAIRRPRSSTTG